MRMTVFLKSDKGALEPLKYEIDINEFRVFAKDFESFIKTGEPQQGKYRARLLSSDRSIKPLVEVNLIFSEVSSVG